MKDLPLSILAAKQFALAFASWVATDFILLFSVGPIPIASSSRSSDARMWAVENDRYSESKYHGTKWECYGVKRGNGGSGEPLGNRALSVRMEVYH